MESQSHRRWPWRVRGVLLAALWLGSAITGLIGILEIVALFVLQDYRAQGLAEFARQQTLKHSLGAGLLLACAGALGLAGHALRRSRRGSFGLALGTFLVLVIANVVVGHWWPNTQLPSRGTIGEAISIGVELAFVALCGLSLLLIRVRDLWRQSDGLR
jgi:hypothetical protein